MVKVSLMPRSMLPCKTGSAGAWRYAFSSGAASGSSKAAVTASTNSAGIQPRPSIRPRSTGTMMNWPKEPAAAVRPMARERNSGATARTITENTTL
ncbi:hypothetical protein D3C72_2207240 [compost metagenome]